MVQCFRSVSLAMLCVCAAASPGQNTSLTLSGIFSDHMVLQRDKPIRVWGQTAPGETVKVTLNNHENQSTADKEGRWNVQLPALSAGGPFSLTVSDSDETTSLKDILVGDVWVCSGQSNMAFKLSEAHNAAEAISGADNEKIRFYQVSRQKSERPQDELQRASKWEVCHPRTADDFSAVGYFFGSRVQEEVDVPIGLIESAWGGTAVQWWTPLEGLEKVAYYRPELDSIKSGLTDKQLNDSYASALATWHGQVEETDPGSKNGFATMDFNDSAWTTVSLPENTHKGYMATHDGTAWYRRTFELNEEQAKGSGDITVRCVDDFAVIYLNGHRVAASTERMKPVTASVPAGTLKPGKNSIAIQVTDIGKAGGVCGSPADLQFVSRSSGTSSTIGLSGEWKFSAGAELAQLPAVPGAPPNIRATALYNAMIHPLVNFPICGVIWYQGESNASAQQAPVYAETFSTMIQQWRDRWNVGDFPFLFVQLASFTKILPDPADSNWALLREQQEHTLELAKNTAMASALDVGDEKDIHPRDKQTVGERLALAALALKYERPLEYMGPIYKSSETSGSEVILSFNHAKALHTRDGEPVKGFSIAGKDGKFVWADARVEGNKVIVSNDAVKEPAATRYGWADYSTGNLYNEANLPASPFRTDRDVK